MSNNFNGFKPLPWVQLKQLVTALPQMNEPIEIGGGQIIGHSQFIDSHIKMVDAAPENKKGLTVQEERRRKSIIPYYERLLKYYYIRIQLIEA